MSIDLMQNAIFHVPFFNSAGIDTEHSYPYTSGDGNVGGTCKFNPNTIGALTVTGCGYVTAGDESALQEAVATVGPISVLIVAEGKFMSYRSGKLYLRIPLLIIGRVNIEIIVLFIGNSQ